MKSISLPVSVIIPTHTRSQALRKTLESLSHQTFPKQYFEVLVVSDRFGGSVKELTQDFQAPFAFEIHLQPGNGPSIRRNYGAARARGELLIFLDDDIVVEPQLIEAHVAAHREGASKAVVGYFPPLKTGRQDFFRLHLKDWWESSFQEMRDPAHRYKYNDLFSGNFSLPAALFRQLGGFDTRYVCRDDSELGYRLLKAGAQISFCEQARGWHHDTTDTKRLFVRKYEEGQADVQLGKQYPELRPALLMSYLIEYSLLPSRVLRQMVFRWPSLSERLINALQPALRAAEKARARNLWRSLFYGIQFYHYWRGVMEKIPSLDELDQFLQAGMDCTPDDPPPVEVDLAKSITAAEQILDHTRPQALRIRYGRQILKDLEPQPSFEPLRGVHLRPLLSTELALPLAKAIILEELETENKADEAAALPRPSLPTKLSNGTAGEELLELTSAFYRELSTASDPVMALTTAVRELCKQFGAASGSIQLVDEQGDRLSSIYYPNQAEYIRSTPTNGNRPSALHTRLMFPKGEVWIDITLQNSQSSPYNPHDRDVFQALAFTLVHVLEMKDLTFMKIQNTQALFTSSEEIS
jgi:GT2 family glycosyltransferase